LMPGQGMILDVHNATLSTFPLFDSTLASYARRKLPARSVRISEVSSRKERTATPPFQNSFSDLERLMKFDEHVVSKLRRCTRCLLPETFPFISFDESGVCQICRKHEPQRLNGERALRDL